MMKKIIVAIIALVYATIAVAIPVDQWIIGKWRIVKIQGYAPIFSNINDKALIGKYLVIKKESMELDNVKVAITNIEVTKENTFENFEYLFRTDPTPLNLPKTVTQIKINYKGPIIYINYIYMLGANSMIFEYQGVFYKAIRSNKK
jgi:hypothetical protein